MKVRSSHAYSETELHFLSAGYAIRDQAVKSRFDASVGGVSNWTVKVTRWIRVLVPQTLSAGFGASRLQSRVMRF